MKKYLVILLVMFFSIYMFGCKKKQVALEEMQEPMSMEALSTMSAAAPAAQEVKVTEAKIQANLAPVAPLKLEALPPAGPYKPTNIEIQTALKDAGFYTAEVDGKIGPKTKKAIEEFQKANGLKADGKVGPKTWALLSSHLNPPAESQTKKKR